MHWAHERSTFQNETNAYLRAECVTFQWLRINGFSFVGIFFSLLLTIIHSKCEVIFIISLPFGQFRVSNEYARKLIKSKIEWYVGIHKQIDWWRNFAGKSTIHANVSNGKMSRLKFVQWMMTRSNDRTFWQVSHSLKLIIRKNFHFVRINCKAARIFAGCSAVIFDSKPNEWTIKWV